MSASSNNSSSVQLATAASNPPEYSFDDPEMSFLVRDQPRRYTTITLKEIKYSYGCDCHPAQPTKKQPERTRALSPDSRPALYTPHSRPEVIQRNNSTDSTDSNASTQSNTGRRLRSFFRQLTS